MRSQPVDQPNPVGTQEAAVAITEAISDALPDKEQAASVERHLRAYPPVWELAHEPVVLQALLLAAQSADDLWWRPARVALQAVAASQGLGSLTEAEQWLIRRDEPLPSASDGEDTDQPHSPDIPSVLERPLISDTLRALRAYVSGESAGWAELTDGVLVCLYEFASRGGLRSDWLASIAGARPSTVARILALNEDGTGRVSAACQLGAGLVPETALDLIGAFEQVADGQCAAAMAAELQSRIPEPPEHTAGTPRLLADAALAHLCRGIAASAVRDSDSIRELERAWGNGRDLVAQVAHHLGRAYHKRSDPLAALVSYRLGLQLLPAHTGLRAATTAALNDLGQYDDALSVVAAAPVSQVASDYRLAYEQARALVGRAKNGSSEQDTRSAAVEAASRAADMAETPVEYREAAELLADLGETRAAILFAERAVAAAPDRAGWQRWLAELYASESDWQTAEHCLRQTVALEPGNVPALRELAVAQRSLGKFDDALETAATAAALNPRDAKTLEEWAAAAHAAGQWDTAVRAGRAALALCTDSVPAHILMGQAYAALEQHEEAVYYLQRATALASTVKNPAPFLALADYYEQRAMSAQLEKALDDGVRAVGERNAGELIFRQGVLCDRGGRLTEAQSAYWRAHQAGNRSSRLLTHLGRVLDRLGHHEQAIARLQEGVAQPDADGSTYHALASALDGAGRVEEALAAARQAAVLSPNDGTILYDGGRLCLAAGDYRGAADLLQKTSQHLPSDPAVWTALGQAHQGARDWEPALQAFSTAARLRPSDPYAQYHIGAVCRHLGRHDTAIAALTDAADQLPGDPAVHRALAEALEAVEWWAQAAEAHRHCAELTPGDPSPLAALARAARLAVNLDDAEDAVARAFEMAPRNPQVLLEKGLLQWARGDQTGAAQIMVNLVQSCDEPALLLQAGDALVKLRQIEAAATAFGRAADLNPDDTTAHSRLGETSAALGRHAQALAAHQAAARLEPANPAHWAAIGDTQWHLNRAKAAAEAWAEALTLNPDDAGTMERLGQAHLKIGDSAAALLMYEKAAAQAVKENKPAGAIWREAARAALALGELDKAKGCLARAVRALPHDPEAHSLAGALADRMGRVDEALQAYRRAAELAPDRRDYHLQLADALNFHGHELDALEVRQELLTDGDEDDAAVAMFERMGRLYGRAGRLADAARALRAALQRRPQDGSLRRQLGSVIVEQAELTDYERRAGIDVTLQIDDLEQASRWLSEGETPQERRDLARARLLLGGIQEAISSLSSYLTGFGDADLIDLNAQRALGVAYRTAGATEASIRLLVAVMRLVTNDVRTGVELVESYLSGGQAHTALALSEWILSHAGENPILLSQSAKAAFRTGELDKAIVKLSRAVELQPDVATWRGTLSTWLRQHQQPAEALKHAEGAVRLTNASADAQRADSLAELAQVETDMGRLGSAATRWQAALDLAPGNAAWWQALGRVLLALGRPEQSVACFSRAEHVLDEATMEPDARLYLWWSRACLALGEVDQAGRYARRAEMLDPQDPAAKAAVGAWQAAAGSCADALTSFQAALLLAGKRPVPPTEQAQFRFLAARAYRELGAVAQAVEELERAVRLDPDHGAALTLLGSIYQEIGERDLARQAHQQAAAAVPLNPTYVVQLARFLQSEGQLDQALDWLTKAVAVRPTADLWLEVARVYDQKGKRGQRMEALQRAVAEEPSNARALFELGVAYKQRKAYEQAIGAFERVTELDPDNGEAHDQLSAVMAMSLSGRMRRKSSKG